MAGTRAPVLHFVGGAGTVTGSKTILDTEGGRLLVDAGLFQGRKKLRLANWSPFPVPPASVDAVVITHAHVDHCGYLPRLVREGFRGPVWCTEGTADLLRIVLPDAAYLQEEEAAYANRRGYSKHDPAKPLYTGEDAAAALSLVTEVPYDEPREVIPGVGVTWNRNGHILGAAWLRLRLEQDDVEVVFSGDLGRRTHPLLNPPEPIGPADVVVLESTYGDELHDQDDPEATIARVVTDTAARGGVLVVPAFAVDRTEVVLWHLDRLVARGEVPDVPVVVDSPMALRALHAYRDAAREGSPEIRSELAGRRLFTSLQLEESRTADDSRALNRREGPLVIVSASGMATGGRVVHHLANTLGDPRNAVLLVGFQAPGTRGDRLRRGETKLKMFGQYHPVRAEVVSVELSSHADQRELTGWLATADDPHLVLVNHGEEDAAAALVDHIEAELGLTAVAARSGEKVRVDRPPHARSQAARGRR
jgi:metallo-beta-lactamase family protein